MTALLLVVLLASELPDPGQPSFATLCAGYGMFVAGGLAWLRRRPISPDAGAGGVAGFGIGLVAWLAALAIDRL
jgi:hypothetical protein